jgi:hypothetical protein
MFWKNDEEKDKLLEEIRELRADLKTKKKELALLEDANRLKQEIEELKISKSRLKEEHDKEDRELRHMIGLEKKRQEFEISQAKRETSVQVREENLTAEKKRFEDEMKFMRKQFESEMVRLEAIYKDIIARLPTVIIDRNIEEKRSGRTAA